jgi:chloramphenicol 3-O phosphotransferase
MAFTGACPRWLAAAGNDLIVEHIIEFRAWREYLAGLLGGLDVFLVGGRCELAEIDRRERDRGDRRTGEGRSHVETGLIRMFGPCDFEVDTTHAVPGAVAASVLAAWRSRPPRRTLGAGDIRQPGNLIRACRYRLIAAVAGVHLIGAGAYKRSADR